MGKKKSGKPLFVVKDAVVTVGNREMFLNLVKRDPLELSITKWKFIASHAGSKYVSGTYTLGDGAGSTCGLCYKNYDLGCSACPVMKRTGKSQCSGTPYVRYTMAESPKDLVKAAKAMVKFLESLRKPKSRGKKA